MSERRRQVWVRSTGRQKGNEGLGRTGWGLRSPSVEDMGWFEWREVKSGQYWNGKVE